MDRKFGPLEDKDFSLVLEKEQLDTNDNSPYRIPLYRATLVWGETRIVLASQYQSGILRDLGRVLLAITEPVEE